MAAWRLGMIDLKSPPGLATGWRAEIVGQLIDLYLLVMPAQGDTPIFGWQELGPTALFIGVLLLYVGVFLGRNKAVAAGDPLFEKSRDFHL